MAGLLAVCACLSAAAAFTPPTSSLTGRHRTNLWRIVSCDHPINNAHWPSLPLFMTNEEDEIDLDSLGDWRQFRMNLINSASASSSSGVTSLDGIDITTETSSVVTKAQERPKSVSKRNEEVLIAQSEMLGEEYLKSVWAHESAIAEIGGLVCRMPLEVELNNPSCSLYYRFQAFLDSYQNDSQNTASTIETRYNSAMQFLKSELEGITSVANENGKIDPADLDKRSVDILQLYLEHQQEWQHVCLVVDKDDRAGTARTIAINRPMAFKLSESLARLVLLGAFQATQLDDSRKAVIAKQENSASDTQLLVKFLTAFENECGVYVGGPNSMEAPATMIHGIPYLPGAVEISPGTGIYEGGIEAACDGILSGKYKPLDFRFFIGHTAYDNKKLDEAVDEGKYQPVACSRPLVLKQCIQLPKPLWHEVLEFCGGELKEISKLELMKRVDL